MSYYPKKRKVTENLNKGKPKNNQQKAKKKYQQHKTKNTCAFFKKINRFGNGYCQKKQCNIQTEFDCKGCKQYKKNSQLIKEEKMFLEALRKISKQKIGKNNEQQNKH